jgi:hypothetical protein
MTWWAWSEATIVAIVTIVRDGVEGDVDHDGGLGCKFEAAVLQFCVVSMTWWTLVSFVTLHMSLIYNVPWRCE